MDIITGMHRSGTSLVARLFHQAGADLGPLDELYPPDRWNPEGYFEQTQILALNKKLVHGPFGRFSYLRLPRPATIHARSQKVEAAIRDAGRRFQTRLVKDPRFCLTLPAWKRQGIPIDKMVICLRDPWQVASSIKVRNKIPCAYGLALWYEHNDRLLRSVGDIPVWFIRLEKLYDRTGFRHEMQRAYRFLGFDVDRQALLSIWKKNVKPREAYGGRIEKKGLRKGGNLWHKLLAMHASQGVAGG